MKRILFVFVVSLFVFSSCFGGVLKVDFLSFYSDGFAELRISPNYEEGILKINYFEHGELTAEGEVGEEYFERFNKLVRILSGSDFLVEAGDYSVEDVVVFGAYFKTVENEFFIVHSFDHFKAEDFSFSQSFYLDILNLLTQEVPV